MIKISYVRENSHESLFQWMKNYLQLRYFKYWNKLIKFTYIILTFQKNKIMFIVH